MIGSTIAQLAVKSGAQVTILDAMLPAWGNLFNLQGIHDAINSSRAILRDLELVRA
jgi:hypothetical protein